MIEGERRRMGKEVRDWARKGKRLYENDLIDPTVKIYSVPHII